MSGGPVDLPNRGTIVPRPGIDCALVVVLEPEKVGSLSGGKSEEMRMSNLQSAINERFAEPEEMGSVAITFRSDVETRTGEFVIVKTTTRYMGLDTIEEIREIAERELGIPMEVFQITTDIRRKSMGADFL